MQGKFPLLQKRDVWSLLDGNLFVEPPPRELRFGTSQRGITGGCPKRERKRKPFKYHGKQGGTFTIPFLAETYHPKGFTLQQKQTIPRVPAASLIFK